MQLLLSAYACAPGWGSEPGIGWGVAAEVAKRHDVWVLTDVQSRAPMEAAADMIPKRLHVHYVEAPPSPLGGGTYTQYLSWQREALRHARLLHRQVEFDVVHHVTYANSAMPSWLGRLGIPFLWYAGSFAKTPLSFLSDLGWRSSAHEIARNGAIDFMGRVTRQVTLARGGMTISVDPPPAWPPQHWRRMLLGGLQPWEMHDLQAVHRHEEPGGRPFRVVSVGRLLGWKGFHLGLRAFARFRHRAPDAEYWLIGDGEQRQRLERLAAALGLGDGVRFLGALPRHEIFAALAACDVMLHPAWHEQVGFAVLEAMACARPVICLGAAGPPQIVGDTGKVVALTTPDGVIDGLASALEELHEDQRGCRALGLAARRRAVDHWNWTRVTDDLDRIYDELVSG